MHDTTSFTAVRSHTSRHTHTYTDNHSTISIHNNTIGHSTCINGTHCYDIPSSTTHVNQSNQCMTPLLSLLYVHTHPDTHTHTQTITHQSVFTTTPLVIAHERRF